MSYHIEMGNANRFDELPERILMRENGWYGAYRFYGEPVIDYWYVPDRTTTAVCVSNGITGHCECELCGKSIDPWDSYCRHCGARVTEVKR